MLVVPTYVAPSGIQGMGLFTAAAIAQGALVWSFNDAVDYRLRADDVIALPKPVRDALRKYVYFEAPGVLVLCGDNARFMNHSFSPNCDEEGPRTVARRDIAAGEELTCDYRELGILPASTQPGEFIEIWQEWDALERRAHGR